MTGQWQLSVVLLFYTPVLCVGLTCLQCTDAPVPRDCGKVKRCGSHEGCFIDSYATASGHIRYNLGCRDTRFCISTGRRSVDSYDAIASNNNSTNDVIGLSDDDVIYRSTGDIVKRPTDDVMFRSSRNVKVCESCCSTDLCNNAGCGDTGYSARQNRGPVCYTCTQQHSPESCDTISVCGLNSICKVKLDAHLTTGDVFYTSSCEDPQVCHQDAVFQNLIEGRKRLTEEVDTSTHKCVVKCCDGDLCNGNCGTGSLAGTSGTGSGTNPCLSNPCVHGSCSVYQGTYVCTCNNGATGRNCDTLPNPCANNPCVHGTCQNSGTSYQCQCSGGYTGTNCDQAPSPCLSSPCHHGVCHTSGSSYYCQCNNGYTGSNCNQVSNPCSGNPCGQHGVCQQNGFGYHCSCYAGWIGTTCHQSAGSVSHNCPTGWLKHDSSCYLFRKAKESWNHAKSLCGTYGAYLAEVNDGSEQYFLIQEGPVAHKGDWWIGGTHRNGRWMWDHSGHSLSGHWDSGWPKSNGWDCVELHKVSHGAWRGELCNQGNYYVCEKAAW